jgi:hypothetical protein
MGAKRETFYGLSGLGDLATTCVSQYSRNRWLGEEIGKGKIVADCKASGKELINSDALCEDETNTQKHCDQQPIIVCAKLLFAKKALALRQCEATDAYECGAGPECDWHCKVKLPHCGLAHHQHKNEKKKDK